MNFLEVGTDKVQMTVLKKAHITNKILHVIMIMSKSAAYDWYLWPIIPADGINLR